ncbi:LSU ribosomal protein L25p [Blastochloris viridis]|uniref:50S ribosomal protein L25 n=1 Tax=Blastochloris viridis TaxID=1079 RepID=A0A182D3T0_BLAVI|nr:LSU ribosomal protein L25p [Blastochloris viridis]
MIYGAKQAPITISLEYDEIKARIFAGRFLTTVFDIQLDGQKHRVIPRDYQLDPVRDFPIHVDFQRLVSGQKVRVEVPIHVTKAEASPGVKRGGAINIVEHTLALLCPPEAIPTAIDIDLTGLDINQSVHLGNIALPDGVVPASKDENPTLVTIVAPSGFKEEAPAATAATAAPAAAAKAPAAAAAKAPAAAAKAPAGKK